ncbi:MAG: hypothetical protein HQ521_20180 [Bacteroidetes bacterium]|nr:hypothetical protein [Bacteroidota bacterium]
MQKLLLFGFLISALLFYNNSYSQTTDTLTLKNYVGVGIAYPFFRTFTVGYERMITKKGFIRVNASGQPLSKKNSYKKNTLVLISYDVNKQKVFTSSSFSVGYGYMIIPRAGLYIATDLTYRYNYFEDKYYYECVGTDSDSRVSLASEYHNDYGLQAMVGIKVVIKKYKGIRFVCDFNAGNGLYLSNQKHVLIAERKGRCSINDLQYFPEPQETNVVTISSLIILRAGLGIIF